MADSAADSSVLVASLIPSDKFFSNGVSAVQKMLTRQKVACASVIVPVARHLPLTVQMHKWVRLGLLELVEVKQEDDEGSSGACR